ncbi:MAG TPA: acyltransferase [Oculatellaceae cyanobacterium]
MELEQESSETSVSKPKSARLNNLDALRFLAANAVIAHHLEQTKGMCGLHAYWDNPVLPLLGPYGVQFFFVLSGFIITYMLLNEKHDTGTIDLKRFYIRRALRIWPLYYLMVGLAFIAVPFMIHFPEDSILGYYQVYLHDNFWHFIPYYVFFLPNFAILPLTPVIGASQLWSLGVEEQFYLIWPILLRIFARVPLLSFVFVLLIRYLLIAYCTPNHLDDPNYIINRWSADCFAVGGITAYTFVCTKGGTAWPSKKELLNLAIAIIPAFLLIVNSFAWVPGLYLMEGSAVVIFFAARSRAWGGLYGLMEKMGKYSYGIYMYHPIVLNFLLSLMIHMPFKDNEFALWILNGLTFGMTWLCAWYSYNYYELPFLKLKEKWEYRKPSAQPVETVPASGS